MKLIEVMEQHRTTLKILLLLIIKNTDEGDGSSILSINNALFRVIREKKIGHDLVTDFLLTYEIEHLLNDGLIEQNLIFNYKILEKGKTFIRENKVVLTNLKNTFDLEN